MKKAALSDDGMRRELCVIQCQLAQAVNEGDAQHLRKRARILKNRLAAKRSRENKKVGWWLPAFAVC